jgi:hypothetical protein
MDNPNILKSMETKNASGWMPGTEYRFTTYEKREPIIVRTTLAVNKTYAARLCMFFGMHAYA